MSVKKSVDAQLLIAGFMGLVGLAALVLTFMSVGSPATNRLRALDQRRIDNLVNIGNCVENHWFERGEVYQTMDQIMDSDSCGYLATGAFSDPQTQVPYEYKVIDQDTYSLCATFALEDNEGTGRYYPDRRWQHDAGYACFEQDLPPRKDVGAIMGEAKPVRVR